MLYNNKIGASNLLLDNLDYNSVRGLLKSNITESQKNNIISKYKYLAANNIRYTVEQILDIISKYDNITAKNFLDKIILPKEDYDFFIAERMQKTLKRTSYPNSKVIYEKLFNYDKKYDLLDKFRCKFYLANDAPHHIIIEIFNKFTFRELQSSVYKINDWFKTIDLNSVNDQFIIDYVRHMLLKKGDLPANVEIRLQKIPQYKDKLDGLSIS